MLNYNKKGFEGPGLTVRYDMGPQPQAPLATGHDVLESFQQKSCITQIYVYTVNTFVLVKSGQPILCYLERKIVHDIPFVFQIVDCMAYFRYESTVIMYKQ